MRPNHRLRTQLNRIEKQTINALWSGYLGEIARVGHPQNLHYFLRLQEHGGCLAIPSKVWQCVQRQGNSDLFYEEEATGLEALSDRQLCALLCCTTWSMFRTIPKPLLRPHAEIANIKIMKPWLNEIAAGAADLPPGVINTLLDTSLNLNFGDDVFECDKGLPLLDNMIDAFQAAVDSAAK